MLRRKKKLLAARRKRMKRQARLQSARHWLAKFTGKNVIRSYVRWFGVDWMCAVKELELLGVKLDQSYVDKLRRTLDERGKKKRPTLMEVACEDGYGVFWEDDFAYIAGRIPAGFAFGVTWEEAEALNSREAELSQEEDEITG